MPGNRGYKYFGAAKDLPGVREVLEREPVKLSRKTRSELIQNVDYDYYGFRDEDDGVILKEEARVQREELIKQLQNSKQHNLDEQSLMARIDEICQASASQGNTIDNIGDNFISHIPSLPTQEEIQQELLRRKKEELLKKYVIPHQSNDVAEEEKQQPNE